jgi:hypothetical protein
MADPAEETVETTAGEPDPQPVEPVRPSREPVQQVQPPPPPVQPTYRPPERIIRAREAAGKLDEMLGASGALKNVIEDLAGVAEDTDRENVQLRQQVRATTDGLNGLGFWQQHDRDPKNKDYPSSDAQADYQKDLATAMSNSMYAGYSPEDRQLAAQAEARGRFFARVEFRQANNKTEPEKEPATAQTRQVGPTRVVPKGVRQVAPAPAKKLTIAEYIERGELPPGYTEADVQAFVENR